MVPELSTDTINLDLDPDVGGDFASDSVTVNVSTNRVSGYTLTMSTEGSSTDLASTEYANYSIAALSNATSATNFADLTHSASVNKWGYATDNNGTGDGQTTAGYYYGVTDSENPTTIKITDAPASTSNTVVSFAAKGKDLASGTYSNTVVFSAVGNPISSTIASLDDAATDGSTLMQEVETSTCANTDLYSNTNKTYTLTDGRDGTTYSVRKLADGNCWMTANLKLTRETITAAGNSYVLDSTNTDLDSATTFTVPADTSTFTTSNYTTAQIHASGDATYGTYYSWPAAIADDTGTAHDTQYDVMSNSICPKNWDLPTGRQATISSNNDWYKLLVTGYGLKDYAETSSNSGNPTSFTGTAYDLPFSGYWNGSSADNQGSSGYFWSSTVSSSSGAYNTYVDSNGGVDAGTGSSSKYYGFAVRCMLASS